MTIHWLADDHGMLPPVQRLLVVRAGAVGDGLLTLPVLAALRTSWPAATLTLLGPRSLLPFVLASGLADAALPIEDEAGLALLGEAGPRPAWAAVELAVVWLRRWHLVAETLRGWGIGTVVAGPSLPDQHNHVHVADFLFRPLMRLDIGPSRPARPLLAPNAAIAAAARWWKAQDWPPDRAVVALHPGSGGARKCWPAGRFAELAVRLLGRGAAVLICLGPAELTATADWKAFAGRHAAVRCASDVTLLVLAGILRHCAGYVGNDAGITHLAAALGLPTLALFGPTDPARWAPLGPQVQVLRDPAWANFTDDTAQTRWSLTSAAVDDALRRHAP